MLLPGATLGLLGGGQLGRMFTVAARTLGYRVVVLDPEPSSPAAQLANAHIAAAYDDAVALDELARRCTAVTIEFENVPASALARLAQQSRVHPGSQAVAIAQDRRREKEFLRAHNLPLGKYSVIADAAALAASTVPYPAILKRACLGYDGKGQQPVANASELRAAFAGFEGVPCVLEQRLELKTEISAIVARGADAAVAIFPLAENRHRNGILDISIVPARVSHAVAAQARAIALTIAEKLDYVGVLAVEFFVLADDTLLVNEMAPRPHNSGHFSLDACVTDQFEQQVRALCGLPLGDTRLLSPAAMVNILGDAWRAGAEPNWPAVLTQPQAKLHLYGKSAPRPGRKMGHFTCLHADVTQALELAQTIKQAL